MINAITILNNIDAFSDSSIKETIVNTIIDIALHSKSDFEWYCFLNSLRKMKNASAVILTSINLLFK